MGTPGRRNRSRADDLGTPEKMPEPISPARSASPAHVSRSATTSRNRPASLSRSTSAAHSGETWRGAGGGAGQPRPRRTPATPEDEVRKNFRSRRVGRTLQNKRSQSVNGGSGSSPRRLTERSWAAAGPEPHPPDRRELRRMYDQIVSERDTLRDHIKMLISDIEKRVETEKRLHAVNVQLRDRLEGLHGEVDEGVHTNAQHKEIRRLTQALVSLPSSPVLTDLLQAYRSCACLHALRLVFARILVTCCCSAVL